MSLCIGLERPVAFKEQRTLKLGLVEAHQLWSVPTEDLVHLPLLLLGVDASDIVVHDRELVTLQQHLLRASIGTPSMLSFLDFRISSSSLRASVVCRCVVATSILSSARSMFLFRGIFSFAVVIVPLLRNFSCHLGIFL